MTEAEIRERMNRIGNNAAKLIAPNPSTDKGATQANLLADVLAVLTQFFIDVHKITERK